MPLFPLGSQHSTSALHSQTHGESIIRLLHSLSSNRPHTVMLSTKYFWFLQLEQQEWEASGYTMPSAVRNLG